MDIQQEPVVEESTAQALDSSQVTNQATIDLVGGPFAVIESDPGELKVMRVETLVHDAMQACLRTSHANLASRASRLSKSMTSNLGRSITSNRVASSSVFSGIRTTIDLETSRTLQPTVYGLQIN